MVQRIKAFAANHDDLSSIPGTYTQEGESQLPQIVLWHVQQHTKIHTTIIETIKNIILVLHIIGPTTLLKFIYIYPLNFINL